MPLARWAVYQGGPQIWVAPTADDSDGWLAQHAAHRDRVGRVRRLRTRSSSRARPSRTTSRVAAARTGRSFGSGGAAIVEPAWGELIAGPLYGEEGMVVADCDLRRGLHAKR